MCKHRSISVDENLSIISSGADELRELRFRFASKGVGGGGILYTTNVEHDFLGGICGDGSSSGGELAFLHACKFCAKLANGGTIEFISFTHLLCLVR